MGISRTKPWVVLEQVVNDLASDLTIHFEVLPNGARRLRLTGKLLPAGNREFTFDADGRYSGAGTNLRPDPPAFK
jgi:hypothetical protein